MPRALTGQIFSTLPFRTPTYQSCTLQVGSQWPGTSLSFSLTFSTPFRSGEINGPEVHANVIDALLANRSIERSPAWVTVALVAAGAAIVGIAGLFLNAWLTGAAAVLATAVLVWLAVVWFGRGLWMPIATPALAIIFAFVGDLAWKYFV